MPVHIHWTAKHLAETLAEEEVPGPLPLVTLVAPSARITHTLRRALIQLGRADILIGLQCLPATALAADVLRGAGVEFETDDPAWRPARLRVLFDQGLDPEHFGNELLVSTRGWPDAFAQTIAELEGAGLRPSDLDGIDEAAVRGLATVWRALEEAAPGAWSAARVMSEAARLLEEDPGRWPYDGPVLGVVSGRIERVRARFLRAIPGVTLSIQGVRPLRPGYVEHLRAALGDEAARAVEAAAVPRADESDLETLRSYLFEPPEVQADPQRPRCGDSPDGTVLLEEHAGADEEVEAAAGWVARQVLERGTPLHRVAVLMPVKDPLVQMVRERLARLPHPDGEFPVYVAGGLPAASHAAGARLRTVVEALEGYLGADDLAAVLPLLRSATGRRPLPKGAAIDLAYSLGTAGGGVDHPEGVREWVPRFAAREEAMARELAELDADEDAEESKRARGRWDLERLLEDLRSVRPAVVALVGFVEDVLEGRPLAELWSRLDGLLEEHVLLPGDGVQVLRLLDRELSLACRDPLAGQLTRDRAFHAIRSALDSLRLSTGRLGDAAVYVGTVAEAAGLSFDAVRVIGLGEGSIPSEPREDPVLPDDLRRAHFDGALPTAADRSLASLHQMDAVVRGAGRELALSAPALGLQRSYREPSSLFLEVAAALGRPQKKDAVPSMARLRATEMRPAMKEGRRWRRDHPVGDAAWQDRVAAGHPALPSRWTGRVEVELGRLGELQSREGDGAAAGLLGVGRPGPLLPGLAPERPLSATRLRTLLECPHRFLLQHVLGFDEPSEPKAQGELDSLAFGSLFHRVAEEFMNEAGAAFLRHEGSLDEHLQRADALARACFEQALEQYPLAGPDVVAQQLERLRSDVDGTLRYMWGRPESRFVATERAFGLKDPVALPVGGGSLFVRGFIDMVDVVGSATRITDFKTGKCTPRKGNEAGPSHAVDAQLALYAMAARLLAPGWGTPSRVAVTFLHSNNRTGREREFCEDIDEFLREAAGWLDTTAGLLRHSAFPRTTRSDDCQWCPFKVVCGTDAYERMEEILAGEEEPHLVSFREMKE